MEILVERRTTSGKIVFETLKLVEKVVFFDAAKARFQVNKDFTQTEAIRGQGGR